MKRSVSKYGKACGLVITGLAFGAAAIYVGETNDAPGGSPMGILLMTGLVVLGVRTALRKTIG